MKQASFTNEAYFIFYPNFYYYRTVMRYDYMSYPFVLKNIFCGVYDATFYCFLLDKRSFSIVYAVFRDKNAIFAV